MGDLDFLPGGVPENATREQQSPGPGAQPRDGHVPAAVRPSTLGSPRQMASLPHPAHACPAPAPGVHQLVLAGTSYLLASSELAGPPQRPSSIPRHLAPPWHLLQGQPVFVFPL